MSGTSATRSAARPSAAHYSIGLLLADVVRQRPCGGRAWLCAAAAFGLALAARFAFEPWLEPSVFLTFYPAVAVSALLCGWRQGAAVLAASALAAHYFFVEPTFSWAFRDLAAAILIVGFLLVGAFLLALVAALSDAVERLDAAARVQEGLFRELQHRVANSMQIAASTLAVARRDIRDEAAAEALDHAAARVRSMARLHRRLYDPGAYAAGLEGILCDVLDEAFQGLRVAVELDIAAGTAAALSIRAMTAVVLLVNEAAVNAAKHAFRPGIGTRFAVSLRGCADGRRMRLTVSDDGPGLGPAVQAADGGRAAERLGMAIMHSFTRQLGGVMAVLEGPGMTIDVTFGPS